MQHSTLNFSHGICPECMNEHFPDVQSKQQSAVRQLEPGAGQSHHRLDIAGK